MAELDYRHTLLGIQGKRTGPLSYDRLLSQRMILLFAAQKTTFHRAKNLHEKQ